MATRAERFKADAQRKGGGTKKVVKHKKPVDPAHTASRHETKRGDKGVGPALEDSTNGKPSRKSTRKSIHGGRSDTQLMRAARTKSTTPKARATRAKAGRT